MPKRERVRIIEEWSDYCKSRQTPKGANAYIAPVQSWIKYRLKKHDVEITIANTNQAPTIIDERQPLPEQVRKLLLSCNPRQAAIVSLIAFAGLRFETISKIKLGDILDLDLNTLKFKESPALIYVPAYANKTPVPYRTFLIKEGCEYLETYLQERKANGEKLTAESPVITGYRGHVTSDWISRLIRRKTRRILDARPYVLRGYFDFQLQSAQIHPRWQSYFMGHRGDVEAVYTVRKHIPEALIKPMREAFKPAEQYLTTAPKSDKQEQERAAALAAIKVLTSHAEHFGLDHTTLTNIQRRLETAKLSA
jgi:hypothetical protein